MSHPCNTDLLGESLISLCTALTGILLSCNCVKLLRAIIVSQTCLRCQTRSAAVVSGLALRVHLLEWRLLQVYLLEVCLVGSFIRFTLRFYLIS